MNLVSRDLSGTTYGETNGGDTSDLTKVLIGALAGAAVGTLIAGSFTQKGMEIRNRVGEGSKNIANNLKDKVSDMTDNLKDKVSNVTDAVADKYESVKEGAAGLIEKGKQKVGMSSGNDDYKRNMDYTGADDTGNNISGSKILLGTIIISVASTIVWSFATEKGNQTRRRIVEGGKNVANTVKEKVSDVAGSVADTASDVYQSAKEGAADLVELQKQRMNTAGPDTSYGSSTGADRW
jgi:gas vesicle protein